MIATLAILSVIFVAVVVSALAQAWDNARIDLEYRPDCGPDDAGDSRDRTMDRITRSAMRMAQREGVDPYDAYPFQAVAFDKMAKLNGYHKE